MRTTEQIDTDKIERNILYKLNRSYDNKGWKAMRGVMDRNREPNQYVASVALCDEIKRKCRECENK
jgi:hypothetical protein